MTDQVFSVTQRDGIFYGKLMVGQTTFEDNIELGSTPLTAFHAALSYMGINSGHGRIASAWEWDIPAELLEVQSTMIRTLRDKMEPGRPATMLNAKRMNVYLDEASVELAKALGSGNTSEGIRIALKRCA